MSDVVYISVNNWFCGRDYPDTPNFRKWLGNDLKQTFSNNDWAKENKLCINAGNIDMSSNYTITAPKEWVEQNCPELLTDDEYRFFKYINAMVDGYTGHRILDRNIDLRELLNLKK